MPFHEPLVPVIVEPRATTPDTTGLAVLTGAAAATVAVGSLAAATVPSGLVTMTFRRTFAPSSATPSV